MYRVGVFGQESEVRSHMAGPQRRIGLLDYAVYAAANGGQDRWIGCDPGHAHLPQSRWLARHQSDATLSGLQVADAETALEAAAAGLSRAVLPRIIAERDARLCVLTLNGRTEIPQRKVWLLSHAEQAHNRAIRAVADWAAGMAWQVAG